MGSSQSLFQILLSRVEKLGARISWGPEGVSERLGRPHVIAVEGDVLPAERGDVSEKIIENGFAVRLVD